MLAGSSGGGKSTLATALLEISGVVKDDGLAGEVAAAERAGARLPAADSRRAVRDAMERGCTIPA